MISGADSCFQNSSQGLQMYGVTDNVASSSLEAGTATAETHSSALLYSLSLLKDKVHQVQSLASVVISPDHGQPDSAAIAMVGMGTLIQEIIVTASSMMFNCQQLALGTTAINSNELHQRCVKAPNGGLSQPDGGREAHMGEGGRGFFTGEPLDWYVDSYNNNNTSSNNDDNNTNHGTTITNSNNNNREVLEMELPEEVENIDDSQGFPPTNYDIIELNATDLLAKYTHYCQVCGKGFKRDANLRMHMRAHGDQYKSSASLSNPMKNNSNLMGCRDYSLMKLPRKYSCPQEGCRWNRNHAKFQPLKSMVCAKNHYKRSHCVKMYVCNRCNQKQFSVLSDLRTHEKHCGELKWQCSCGTTFSRKDKLLGHVALFTGHAPVGNSFIQPGRSDHAVQIQ